MLFSRHEQDNIFKCEEETLSTNILWTPTNTQQVYFPEYTVSTATIRHLKTFYTRLIWLPYCRRDRHLWCFQAWRYSWALNEICINHVRESFMKTLVASSLRKFIDMPLFHIFEIHIWVLGLYVINIWHQDIFFTVRPLCGPLYNILKHDLPENGLEWRYLAVPLQQKSED